MRFLINQNVSKEQALELINQPTEKVAVDLETVSLENQLPLGLGVAVSPKVGFYFFDTRDELAHKLIDRARVVVFQNAKFDIPMLRVLGYDVGDYEDTLLMAYSAGILEGSLEALARDILFKHCPSVTDLWRKKDQGNIGIDHTKLGEICIIHACLTYALEEALPKTELYHNIDKPCIELLMEMEKWGIRIDQYALTRVEQATVGRAFPLEEELKGELGVENLGSNPQVAEALKKLGIIGTRKTKSAKDSVGEESLRPLDLPLTNKLLKWRSLMKTISTYVPAFRRVDEQGRIHTVFKNANTGRWRSGDRAMGKPNLQNITRDDKFTEEED